MPVDLLPEVRRLMSERKGDRVIAETLEITRHQARNLMREVERANGGGAGGPIEVPVALCRASPTARPIKPGHVLVLAESIKEIGLRQPINVRAIDDGYEIRGGGHRHAAFVMLERETIPAIVSDDNDLRAELAEIDENLIRNDLSPAERDIAIARRKGIYEALHPETKIGATGKGRSKVRQVGEANAPVERFSKATAEATGQGERTIQRSVSRVESIGAGTLQRVIGTALDKGEEIDALGKLSPAKREEVIVKAEAGEKVSATLAVKQESRAAREREMGQKQIAAPQGQFGVILEDFEWDYEPRSRETGMDRHAANHYETAEDAHTPEEIVERTRERFVCAAPDCVLFMCATNPHLAIAMKVLELRGFKYVSNYALLKDRIITGWWNRGKHEILLIGIKGKPPCPAPGTQWDSTISVPVGEHSAKGEIIQKMIEEYYPTMPKIELNRRGAPRPGWEAWGNEATAAEAAE